jgi:hypothetical protein
LGIDLNVIGIPVGVELGFGSSDKSSKEQKSSTQFKDTEHLDELSNSYMKTRYFVEPRQMIVVDPAWLQPTPALKEAFRKVKESLATSNDTTLYSVDHLFRDFGTHTCTRAMLGGWWKISAQYYSTDQHKVVEMSTVTTNAIDNQVEKSSHFNFKVEAWKNELGFKYNDKTETQQKENSRKDLINKEVIKDNNSMVDISQEWKGGISGLQSEDWRASLDDSMNSNWKIIDRYVDSCMGLWRWVEDDEDLKSKICEGWRKGFVRDMLEHGVNTSYKLDENTEEWNSCTGAAYMGSFRNRVM